MATPRRNLTDKEIEEVWQKANIIPNNNPNIYRQDYAGAWIRRDLYGRTDTEYGWEIDHRKPLTLDGTYDKSNLDPLQWNNNRTKDDNYPRWKTSKSSSFNKNVDLEKWWKVE